MPSCVLNMIQIHENEVIHLISCNRFQFCGFVVLNNLSVLNIGN